MDRETRTATPTLSRTGYSGVVVPLDGSPMSALAGGAARTVARRLGIPVEYLTVVDPAAERAAAIAACERFATDGELTVVTGVRPAASIVDRIGGRLLVMASHGRGRLGATVIGSVAEQVLRSASGAIVLVGPRFDASRFVTVERVVATVDGSRHSEAILPTAAALASDLGVGVDVVEVLDSGVTRQVEASHGDVLENGTVLRASRRVASMGVGTGWEVLHGEDPVPAIVDHAAHRPGVLLAMATHGRSGAARLAGGSVTIRVVHHASAPVLVVRPASLPIV